VNGFLEIYDDLVQTENKTITHINLPFLETDKNEDVVYYYGGIIIEYILRLILSIND